MPKGVTHKLHKSLVLIVRYGSKIPKISFRLWTTNIENSTFQGTPHVKPMRGDLKHGQKFTTICCPRRDCDAVRPQLGGHYVMLSLGTVVVTGPIQSASLSDPKIGGNVNPHHAECFLLDEIVPGGPITTWLHCIKEMHAGSLIDDKDLSNLQSQYLGCWWPGPVFCLLQGISSGCAWPITGQVTSVTCPVIGWAQSELTPSKKQKTGPVDARGQDISSHAGIDLVTSEYSSLSYSSFSTRWINDISGPMKVIWSHWTCEILEENMSNFPVRTVSADGLALLGARPSAGTLMTKFGSCISMHLSG